MFFAQLPPRILALLLVTIGGQSISAEPASNAAGGDTFLRDFAETRGWMLGRPVAATPTPDGSAVLFLRARGPRDPSQELYEFDVATGTTRRLLSPDEALRGAADSLTPEEKARRERQRISVGGFTSFSISKNGELVLLGLSGKLYVLDRGKRDARQLATGPGVIVDPKFSPDSRSVAYVRDQDIYVLDLASGKESAITTGGTETIANGLAEFVAQEEMYRYSGYWWSPDSRRIVYQQNDASQVEKWYIADPASPGTDPAHAFYPRPGKNNVDVRVGVTFVDLPGETVWLDWDRVAYPYLGKVTWSADGPLCLTVLSRDQTNLALLQADPVWGDTHPLLTEHDDAWVNLPTDVPAWLSAEDGGGFLWASERDGWRELEWHYPDGRLDTVLTEPRHNFSTLVGVAGHQALGTFRFGNPAAATLRRVPLRSFDANSPALDGPDGLSQGTMGDSTNLVVVQKQGWNSMPQTFVRRLSDGHSWTLPSIALEPSRVPDIGPENRETPDLSHDGNEKAFASVIIRPKSYDAKANHRYPVIVDVYAGPQHQQVTAAMRPYLIDQWIADQGFVVIAMDGRGTPGRGRDWERATAGHFGLVALDDQVAALQALAAKHPEMDMSRVGVAGWSFGGYMSALATLHRPDIFKAGVAGAPVVDWLDYDTCYTERYLGVPGQGRWPNAYRESSLLTYAGELRRPLLLIHGTADDNVYTLHSIRLIDALFRAGKPVDFLLLGGFTHMVAQPIIRTRLEERIVDYFHAHLGE